jgi:hypothetical protein
MRPWLVVLGGVLSAAITGAAIGLASRRGMLAGVRDQVPSGALRVIGGELEDVEARARRAGAQGELEYMGAGATGIVLCDARGEAFKVARGEGSLANEATWMRLAAKMPSTGQHIARGVRYNAAQRVLIRECARGQTGGWKDERKLRDLHDRIEGEMIQYGWTSPEFKGDSYVTVRGRGPVLIDASAAHRVGHALVSDTLAVLGGRRQLEKYERLSDLAFSLRMERGRTVPEPIADRLLVRLRERDPQIEA